MKEHVTSPADFEVIPVGFCLCNSAARKYTISEALRAGSDAVSLGYGFPTFEVFRDCLTRNMKALDLSTPQEPPTLRHA